MPTRPFKYPPSVSQATLKQGNAVNTGGYKSNVRGWVLYNDREYYFKSLWEMNFAAYLQWLVIKREVKSWEYEPATFQFPKDKYKAGPYYYKIDFKVIENSGKVVWYEVKGFMNNESKKKIARYKKHHEENSGQLIIVDKLQMTNIAKFKRLIPNWLSLDEAIGIFSTPLKVGETLVWKPVVYN